MVRVSVGDVKAHMSDTLNRAGYGGERLIIERRGRDVAVLISLDDLRLLEELEDAADLAAARMALAESDERIPYERARGELGL